MMIMMMKLGAIYFCKTSRRIEKTHISQTPASTELSAIRTCNYPELPLPRGSLGSEHGTAAGGAPSQ